MKTEPYSSLKLAWIFDREQFTFAYVNCKMAVSLYFIQDCFGAVISCLVVKKRHKPQFVWKTEEIVPSKRGPNKHFLALFMAKHSEKTEFLLYFIEVKPTKPETANGEKAKHNKSNNVEIDTTEKKQTDFAQVSQDMSELVYHLNTIQSDISELAGRPISLTNIED